jgi:hypothetical protein
MKYFLSHYFVTTFRSGYEIPISVLRSCTVKLLQIVNHVKSQLDARGFNKRNKSNLIPINNGIGQVTIFVTCFIRHLDYKE